MSATRRQHQPPCQAPCTSTKVLRACASAGVPPSAAVPAPAIALASALRRVIVRSLVPDIWFLPTELVVTIRMNCSGRVRACRGLLSFIFIGGVAPAHKSPAMVGTPLHRTIEESEAVEDGRRPGISRGRDLHSRRVAEPRRVSHEHVPEE